jgi:tol-pal system protein YbgF
MRYGIESQLVLLAVMVCLAGLVSGCATTSETSTIQQNLAILNERQAAMESRVQNAEGASQRGGDLYSRIEELQTKMRTLNGRLEELEHKVDQLQRSQAPPPAAAPPPVGIEEGLLEAPPAKQPSQAVTPPVPAEPGGAGPAAPSQAAAPPNRSAEQAQFDAGVQLFQQKKYEAARKEFQAFLSKFPKSGLEEGALYNIGECYYSEKRYEDSIKAFQQTIDKYPKGSKTPSALLKQGMAWQQMGETTMARIIYTRLVEKYPGTAQAQAAGKKLQQM